MKLRRSIRYVHLNPCRAALVDVPLAWAWSTHRDRAGLAAPPVVAVDPAPRAFHAYVSADPTVHTAGSSLLTGHELASLEAIAAAVSAVTRTPAFRLAERGRARSLLFHSLRSSPIPEVARALGLHPTTLRRQPDTWTREVRVVSQVLGDPRCSTLESGDPRLRPGWSRHRHRP